MKRFLIFSGDGFYPRGGALDYKDSVETKDDVFKFYDKCKNNALWINCIDTDTNQLFIVYYDSEQDKAVLSEVKSW